MIDLSQRYRVRILPEAIYGIYAYIEACRTMRGIKKFIREKLKANKGYKSASVIIKDKKAGKIYYQFITEKRNGRNNRNQTKPITGKKPV